MPLTHEIICSENTAALSNIAAGSLDICITDPPYGMDIAGVGWDHNVPPKATWDAVYRVLKPGAFVLSFCSPEYYHRMAVAVEDAGFRPLDMIFWMNTTKMAKTNRLKPAHEPIFVAQKPLEGSIANNMNKYGVGAINTETTRVPWDGEPPKYPEGGHTRRAFGNDVAKAADQGTELVDANPNGRYPTNIIGHFDNPEHQKYFYAPRATREERGEYNDHPTPKPIALMRYLCRVYAPKGSTVLDPFCGSGTTGIAALQEGMNFVGIDMSEHYCSIAKQRIQDNWENNPVEKLFEYE
jgi:DNA modification methylase